MEAQTWRDVLKPGDKVFIGGSLANVSKVTSKQIMTLHENGVGGEYERRFWKKNGVEVGSDAWHFSNITEATPERIEKHRIAVRRNALLTRIKNTNFSALSEEQLDEILTIAEQSVEAV